MATSRSPEGAWTAGASLFSGRPDPTWPVAPDVARELVRSWEELPLTEEAVPAAPPLGYRGCILRAPDGREWRAYGGVVESRSGAGREARRDRDRSFERRLVASAPAGLLPANLFR